MIRFAFTALALTVAAAAQPTLFGGNEERASSTKLLLDPAQGYKMLGGACIQYGQPAWKADYEGQLEGMKGKSWRMGKNYWTTLNAMSALTIGGVNVPSGSYYLGMKYDEKGNFHLLVIDTKKADTNLWSPFVPTEWKADYTCPMTHAKADKVADKLSITLNGETPNALELKVHWGNHQVTANVAMNTTANNAPAKAVGASMEKVEKAVTETAEKVKKLPEAVKK